MRSLVVIALIGIGLAATGAALAEQTRTVGERHMRRVLRQAFPNPPEGWQARLQPDQTMATCSTWRNQPPAAEILAIKGRERAGIRYPDDGVLVGDWQRGQALAQSGYGLRFTDSPPRQPNGGNCYACHQLSPGEVSFGTIGVSLTGYGRLHEYRQDAARLVYDKIFNSQAIVPCSLMPRFGANGVLSIDQIKDLVAYVMDPESPVNKPLPTSGAPATRN